MISVIMSTYKEEEYQLRLAIESILNQSYKAIEFIVILDNPDNELHKQIIESYQKRDKRIRFYINEVNQGLTFSLNRGLKIAEGEWIARMDADDVSLPDRLKKQFEYLNSNGYDLVGGITQIIDENGDPIYSIQKVPTDPEKIRKLLRYGQCIAHPTWLGRKEVFTKLSGYRAIPLCEDYDFTLRAQLAGYKISNLNEPVLKYRMTSNSISRQNLFEQYLYMRYITGEYKKGNVANIDSAKLYVQKNNDAKSAKKYLKANVIFNRMLKEMENRNYLAFVKDGFLLIFSSKFFLNKIFRFAMLSLKA